MAILQRNKINSGERFDLEALLDRGGRVDPTYWPTRKLMMLLCSLSVISNKQYRDYMNGKWP